MTTLAVFFPSLMGFGILVSGALLISDAVHRLLPNRSRRRRSRLATGAHGVVAAAAAAADRTIEPPGFLTRAFRSRLTYLTLAALSGAGLALVIAAGVAAYGDPKGVFYRSPWIQGLTIGFAIAFGVVCALMLVLAVAHRRSPQPLRRLVRATSLGRLEIPATWMGGDS